MYTKNEKKKCGSREFNSICCQSKIRKNSKNRFESITLIGKHAFDYSVVIQNNYSGELKSVSFPTRKEAIRFFRIVEKRYK